MKVQRTHRGYGFLGFDLVNIMKVLRNRSPRIKVQMEVKIKDFQDGHVIALTNDVSIGGFAIECSMVERDQLTPQGDIVYAGKPVEVEVNLQVINQQGGEVLISGCCRVVYSRRVAQNKCMIGFCFLRVHSDGQDKLGEFVQNVLAK